MFRLSELNSSCAHQEEKKQKKRNRKLEIKDLNCFFNPKTIAVIGASERDSSLGARILCNLRQSYLGSVFPVNAFRQTVQGITAYPSISKVPTKVDLSIIATPAHTIPQIVEECGQAGVSGIIIVSAGFDGTEGQDFIRKIGQYQRLYGMRIIGPNSYGVIRPKNNLYATFGDKRAIDGKIAFISQSAALCGTVLDWSQETQVGLSAVVSVGSTIDIKVSDLLEYFGTDSQTRAIMIYVESLTNVRDFMSSARGFARSKPIVIVKAGRFHESNEFTIPPDTKVTQDDIYDSAFRRIGIVRVDTINELFDCAKAVSMQPNPNDSSLTIITNASGPGVLAADQLSLKGGKLAPLSVASALALRDILPYYCQISNPIDILEEATPGRYRNVLQACLSDPASGSILVIYSPQGLTHPTTIANMAIELSESTRKTLLIALMGEDSSCQEARKLLNQRGIPAFRTPEDAVSAFMNMYTYTRNLQSLYQTPQEIELNVGDTAQLKATIRRAFGEGRQVLSIIESFGFLEAYKIPTAKTYIAKSVEVALSIARQTGYPFTMKPVYAQSAHNQVGIAPIDVYTSCEFPALFNGLVEKIKSSSSFVDFQSVAIQPKIRNSENSIFLGLREDSNFGSLIVLGTGGTCPEVIGNVSVGFPPLDQIHARQLMEKAMARYGSELANALRRSLIEEMLVKFSQLAIDFPELAEVNVNLVVDDSGATAVDASIAIDRSRVMREPAEHGQHLIIAPYPKKYITHRTLKNGLQVNFRPIKSEDELRFNELFKSLSQESVHFRFFEIIKEMSHDTLSRYCNLDYDREIAVVAELQNDGQIIGVVRLIVDSDRKKGEFAVMVADAWHGLGLGSKLMDYIIEIAKDLKLEAIYSLVSCENYKMVRLCGRMGFESKSVDEYTVEMRVNLPP